MFDVLLLLFLKEIFTLIQPDDIRMLRRNQQHNLCTLLTQAVSQLQQIVDTPLPKYYPQAINCIRVLTRVMPFVLEDRSDEFVEELIWGTGKLNFNVDNAEPQEENVGENIDTSCGTPLGERLIEAVLGLLFLPDFTVSAASYKAYREQFTMPTTDTRISKVYPSLLW